MPMLSANSCRMSACFPSCDNPSSVPDLCNGVFNGPLVSHIALVADEQLVHTLSSVSVNLLQPLLDVVERVHVSNIVDDADAVGASVVGGRDCSESLLAGSIPLLLVRTNLPILVIIHTI